MPTASDVTEIVLELRAGDPNGADRLLPIVYQELRRLANSYLHSEPGPVSIQPTELVHEVYLKLVDQTRVDWRGKAHFFAVAAQAMRRLLVDRARRRRRQKRGGDRTEIRLLDQVDAAEVSAEPIGDLVELDLALEELAARHPEKARVVELRFFGGLTTKEIARVLEIGTRTVERHWTFARAWLYRELARERDSVAESGV